jgi:hypothetical protein
LRNLLRNIHTEKAPSFEERANSGQLLDVEREELLPQLVEVFACKPQGKPRSRLIF